MARSSILYVIPPVGGTPAAFTLPRLRRHGEVHALTVGTPPAEIDPVLLEQCASVSAVVLDAPMPSTIVEAAEAKGAGAVLTLSETGIVAVAEACGRLGLRGPGLGVLASRDKVLMRQRWQEAGLPQPAFGPVRSSHDLAAAAGWLRRPFLLKPSWLAGSLAQVVIRDGDSLAAAWRRATGALGRVGQAGVRDFVAAGDGPQFIAEELIDAGTKGWYDLPGHGDYVSVEGLVVGGRYHPVAITGRLPTLPPFIELGFQSPAAMSEERQRRIEDLARAAVDALGLEFCATHTEIKLQDGGGLCLLESAARLGGSMIARLVQDAFDVDLIGLQAETLLNGVSPGLPARMLTQSRTGRCVASLMVMAADSSGHPWDLSEPLPYRPDLVDWSQLTTPGTRVEPLGGRLGAPVPPFTPTADTLNSAGTLIPTAADPATLLRDCYRVLDGLEVALQDAAAGVPA